MIYHSSTHNILFCVVGGQSEGLGHIERSITLAKKLNIALGRTESLFIVPDISVLRDKLHSENILFQKYPPQISISNLINFFRKTLKRFHPILIVSDQKDTSPEIMRVFRSTGAVTLNFDDLGEGGYLAHILVDANREKSSQSQKSIFRIKNLRYHPTQSPVEEYRKAHQIEQEQLFGVNYILLKPQFLENRKKKDIPTLRVKKVFISMGGEDASGTTIKIISALNKSNMSLHLIVVIGAGFSLLEKLNEALSKSENTWETHKNVPNIAEYMVQADIAITGGGITLYELASLGIPSITICTALHQIPIANRLEKQGITLSLRMADQIDEIDITESFRPLVNNWHKRISMSQKGKAYVDGKGLFRIVEVILSYLHKSFPTADFYERPAP